MPTAGLPAVACGEEAGVPPRAGAPLASETEFNDERGGELAIFTDTKRKLNGSLYRFNIVKLKL